MECRAIEEDVRWLGFQWDKRLWASDYFDEMYDCVTLIKKRLAFVCDLNADEMREYRVEPLQNRARSSAYRNRSIEEFAPV